MAKGNMPPAPSTQPISHCQDYISFEGAMCEWGDYFSFTGEEWQHLCNARFLERLLCVESASHVFSGILPEGAFAGRRRKMETTITKEEQPCRYNLVVNPDEPGSSKYDLYPGKDTGGNLIWPSTTR